jgi:hypothetical protein
MAAYLPQNRPYYQSPLLAKLLALTGQITELDLLLAQVRQIRNGYPMIGDWKWAIEMRAWVRRHPKEAYKCGLYCLDQLGRLTQPGQFFPKNITENDSSTNGFTAAELLNVAARAGLRVHAAIFTDTNNLPVPSIVHLRSEHFVLIRERRGAFYEVMDPVAYGPKWLLGSEIIDEATGCVVVSDASAPVNSNSLLSLSATDAAGYRGRCHGGLLSDQNDHGGCSDCPCPPGSGPGPGPGPEPGPTPQIWSGGCSSCSAGMPTWHVNEPYLNLWLSDTPMPYTPAFGPGVELEMTLCSRAQQSALSPNYWYGASFGTPGAQWDCAWFSFAELSSDGYLANVMLPGGGWTMCAFTNNSTYSSINYHDNLWLEKQGPNAGLYPNSVTNLVLHFRDGSVINYGLEDTTVAGQTGYFT